MYMSHEIETGMTTNGLKIRYTVVVSEVKNGLRLDFSNGYGHNHQFSINVYADTSADAM